MILSATIHEKSFGDKRLFNDASFFVDDNEKVGLIGRNGEGKTTLFRILSGEDKDYQGEITLARGAALIATRQEHHGFEKLTVLDYILQDLPQYSRLKHIIETYPETMGSKMHLINEYTEALEQFDALGYYTIENDVEKTLTSFQLEDRLNDTLSSLSGGQKRLVEVTKVMISQAHLALIDEPTNHMDYIAKDKFLQWMTSTKEAMLVISHDRDVLERVDRSAVAIWLAVTRPQSPGSWRCRVRRRSPSVIRPASRPSLSINGSFSSRCSFRIRRASSRLVPAGACMFMVDPSRETCRPI